MDHTVRIVEGRVLLPSGPWGLLPDAHYENRGHFFYPPFSDLARIPPLRSTANTPAPGRILHVHYFVPEQKYDWYVAELDPTTGKAFGWLRAGGTFGEWGEFILGELEDFVLIDQRQTRGPKSAPQVIQRDRAFRPTAAAHCLPGPTL